MASEQILKNTRSTLEVTFSVGDADGAVTVTSLRADGTAGPTGAATNEAEAGRYTFVLAPQAELDLLTVLWSGSWGGVAQSIVSYAEIVGAFLFSLADLRAHGDRALTNTTNYPDADLREKREEITDFFQDVCDVSFIPRLARETVDASGTYRLPLRWPRATRLISVSVDTVALTSPELALLDLYQWGSVRRESGWLIGNDWRNVVVAYEHGYQTPPARVSRAAMILARYELVSNDISDRTISMDSDLGTVRLSVPGTNYPTGLPIVDSTLNRYDENLPVGV